MYYSWRNRGGLKCKGQLGVQKREGQSERGKNIRDKYACIS